MLYGSLLNTMYNKEIYNLANLDDAKINSIWSQG
jgi:hypothetical protein